MQASGTGFSKRSQGPRPDWSKAGCALRPIETLTVKRRDAFGVPLDLKHVGTQFEEQDVPQSLTVNTAAEDLLRVDYLKADFHIGVRTIGP